MSILLENILKLILKLCLAKQHNSFILLKKALAKNALFRETQIFLPVLLMNYIFYYMLVFIILLNFFLVSQSTWKSLNFGLKFQT